MGFNSGFKGLKLLERGINRNYIVGKFDTGCFEHFLPDLKHPLSMPKYWELWKILRYYCWMQLYLTNSVQTGLKGSF